MKMRHTFRVLLLMATALGLLGGRIFGQGTATSVTGLYYTGINNNGSLRAGGSTDPHWSVSYASTTGTGTQNTTYEGSTYVITKANVNGSGYSPNTASAQWITAVGATQSNGTNPNSGGDYLPGNGTVTSTGPGAVSATSSGMGNTNTYSANVGVYYYSLNFTVNGTGSGTVGNQVTISLTMAADDNYSIYLNPTYNANGTINTASSILAGSAAAAWGSTQTTYLQNFIGGGHYFTGNFVVGTNTLVVEVDNTNGNSGNSLNASGLLVYQVGASATTISPNPIPEVGAWLPVALAMGLFGWRRLRSREAGPAASIA